MNRLVVFAVSVVGLITVHAAKIEQVIVRQQWPWSTDVKVEYKLSGVTSPVDISVKAYNGNVELPLPETAVVGDRYGVDSGGVGQFVIDPVAAFGTKKIALANFKVKLTVVDSAGNTGDTLYRIFDLASGECTDVTRADLLNGKYGAYEKSYAKIGEGYETSLEDVIIWTGVTNYPGAKTDKLIMRKISAADRVWQIGSSSDEPGRAVKDSESQYHVRLSKDYFIGVFEMTQRQYELICGSNPSKYTQADAQTHPVENISYSNIRGNMTYQGASGELINWPTNTYAHEVVAAPNFCFLRLLREKCNGVEFDLPTDAQWEYACRAGTTTSLSDGLGLVSGSSTSPRLDPLGWYTSNSDGVTHTVGLKRPNAFGLYDMHGNVKELCVNWGGSVKGSSAEAGTSDDPLVDPKGSIAGSGARTTRGGDCDSIAGHCRSAVRFADLDYYAKGFQGFRVVCPAGETW